MRYISQTPRTGKPVVIQGRKASAHYFNGSNGCRKELRNKSKNYLLSKFLF